MTFRGHRALSDGAMYVPRAAGVGRRNGILLWDEKARAGNAQLFWTRWSWLSLFLHHFCLASRASPEALQPFMHVLRTCDRRPASAVNRDHPFTRCPSAPGTCPSQAVHVITLNGAERHT